MTINSLSNDSALRTDNSIPIVKVSPLISTKWLMTGKDEVWIINRVSPVDVLVLGVNVEGIVIVLDVRKSNVKKPGYDLPRDSHGPTTAAATTVITTTTSTTTKRATRAAATTSASISTAIGHLQASPRITLTHSLRRRIQSNAPLTHSRDPQPARVRGAPHGRSAPAPP